MANTDKQSDKLTNRKEYILRPGHVHHGVDKDGVRQQYVGGDKVLLSEQQYKAFGDKFESQEDAKARMKLQEEAAEARAQLEEARTKLSERGINLDELLAGTIKKPDPTPSTGAAEPTPATTTPAPVGSTPDPVNTAPATPAGKPNPSATEPAKPAEPAPPKTDGKK